MLNWVQYQLDPTIFLFKFTESILNPRLKVSPRNCGCNASRL